MTEWISWNGGECPIPGAKVGEYEVEFEDGAMRGNSSGSISAILYDWSNSGSHLNIIAYRLIEKEQSDLDWLECEVTKRQDDCIKYMGMDPVLAYEYVLDLIKSRKEAKS